MKKVCKFAPSPIGVLHTMVKDAKHVRFICILHHLLLMWWKRENGFGSLVDDVPGMQLHLENLLRKLSCSVTAQKSPRKRNLLEEKHKWLRNILREVKADMGLTGGVSGRVCFVRAISKCWLPIFTAYFQWRSEPEKHCMQRLAEPYIKRSRISEMHFYRRWYWPYLVTQ